MELGKKIAYILRRSHCIIGRELKNKVMEGGKGGLIPFLKEISENKGISQEDLSVLLKIDKTTIARGVKKLIDMELVERKKNKLDKRVYELYLSEKGEDLIPELNNLLIKLNDIFFRNFTSDEKENLNHLLDKVLDNINEEVEKNEKKSD